MQNALPLLMDFHSLVAAMDTPHRRPSEKSSRIESWGPLRQGIHRRYLRICFVHQELGSLDFSKAQQGIEFNEFIFEQIDFSIYYAIPQEDFVLFSSVGLEDFDEGFYNRFFQLDKAGAEAMIQGAYTLQGSQYCLRNEKFRFNPLLMSIMRNVHTSIDFAPLLSSDALLKECTALVHYLEQGSQGGEGLGKEVYFYLARGFKRFYARALAALDGASLRHPDGAITRLSAKVGSAATDRSGNDARISLLGVFNPGNKPYTIELAHSCGA